MPAVEEAFGDSHMARTHLISVHLRVIGQFDMIEEVNVQRLEYHAYIGWQDDGDNVGGPTGFQEPDRGMNNRTVKE